MPERTTKTQMMNLQPYGTSAMLTPATGLWFYKTLRRSMLVRIVAWYGEAINRAAGYYGQRLADTAAHHKGLGPEQRQAIVKEVQDFARKRIDQRMARGWLGLFLVNRIEPDFSKMVTKVITELAGHESRLISETKANLKRAAAIYGEKPRMRRYSDQRSMHLQSKREREIREIAGLGYKGLRYCREMDTRKVSAALAWLNEGWPGTYEGAYRRSKRWQKRIQQEKWRVFARVKFNTRSE